MNDKNKLIKLEVGASEINALENLFKRLPKMEVVDSDVLKALSILDGLKQAYDIAEEVGPLEKPKRILSKVKEIEYLQALTERLLWKIRGLKAIPILQGGLNYYTGEINTAAAIDLLFNPEEVNLHCTNEHSGDDYPVRPRNIIAIESNGNKKRIYLKEPAHPKGGGISRYLLEKEDDMETLINDINVSSQVIVMRISSKYAINIFEFAFSKRGKFVFIGEKFDPKFKLKKEIDIDSKFDYKLYHKATSEFETYHNLMSKFQQNLAKIEMIKNQIIDFKEFYGKESDTEDSSTDNKENDYNMNILKIVNGKIEIRKDSGTLIRTIGNGDAINADFNATQTLVAITTIKGKVEIRKESGTLVRTIGNGDATNARWHGADLAISTIKGKTEIRKESGTLIRTI